MLMTFDFKAVRGLRIGDIMLGDDCLSDRCGS